MKVAEYNYLRNFLCMNDPMLGKRFMNGLCSVPTPTHRWQRHINNCRWPERGSRFCLQVRGQTLIIACNLGSPGSACQDFLFSRAAIPSTSVIIATRSIQTPVCNPWRMIQSLWITAVVERITLIPSQHWFFFFFFFFFFPPLLPPILPPILLLLLPGTSNSLSSRLTLRARVCAHYYCAV